MSEKTFAVPEQRGLEKRPANSRKLLARKAREKAVVPTEMSLESCFPPGAPLAVPSNATEPEASDARTAPLAPAATAAPVTSSRHSKACPQLRPGEITPNPGTVVAAIVRLVVQRGEVSRAQLIDLMSEVSFDHPKARAAEKGWSQGYVAGAIRGGFLAVAAEPSTPVAAPGAGEECQPW